MMAWLAVALAAPPTLCEDGESPRFACEVKGGRVAALCVAPDGAVYRFGAPGAVELRVPAAGRGAVVEAGHRATGPDAAATVFSLWNDGHRYALAVDRTEDAFEGRVVVRQGAEALATLPCTGPVSADTTGLPGAFGGDPSSATAWVGTWSGPDGELVIREAGGGLQVKGQALWHGGGGVVHDGQVEGALARTGATARYASEGCELTLERTAPDTLEAKDNLRCGGMNVTFEGTWHRLP